MSLELGQTNGRGGQFPVTNGTGGPAMTDLDAPLIGDAAGLRASWQRIQAEFVDDPREAVVDAAALVEHVTQTLVGTLRQRQQRLRGMWDGSAAQATFTPYASTADGGFRPTATFTPKHAGAAEADTGGPGATFTPNDAAATDAAPASEGVITGEDVRNVDSGRVPAGDDPHGGDYQDADLQDGTGVRDSAAPAGNGVPPAPVPAPAGAGQPAAGVVADTEQLRLVLRRYRSLLDQLCPPA
jgi:hypothetical protein